MKLLGILLYIGIATAVTVDVNDPAVANRLSVPAPPSTGNEAERDFTPAAWTELDDRAGKVSPCLITALRPLLAPLPFSLDCSLTPSAGAVGGAAPQLVNASSAPPTPAYSAVTARSTKPAAQDTCISATRTAIRASTALAAGGHACAATSSNAPRRPPLRGSPSIRSLGRRSSLVRSSLSRR